MRVALFSSQFFNVINYLLIFSRSDHEIIWVPLVPLGKQVSFEEKIAKISELKEKRIQIRPIFLYAPNNSFKNILNPRILLGDLCKILRVWVQTKPEAIIVPYVLDAYPFAILKNLFDSSLSVIATGGDINLHQSWLHTFVRRMIYKRSNIVLAVSKDLRSKILRESGHESIVVPTGTDPSFFKALKSREHLRTKWGFTQEDVLLLTVGNLEKNKGVDVPIRAIELLRNRRIKNLKMIIVGEGSQKNLLMNLSGRLDLRNSIDFLGEKTRGDLLELYNIADFFILTSHSEGLPFSLLEAMACETICICTPVGDIPDVIKDGVNGFIVNSANPIDLARKVERILEANELDIAKLKGNARTTVLENFDLNKISEKILDLVCNVRASKN